jgi:hypothetical protein
MIKTYFILLIGVLIIQSCDQISSAVIVNASNDTLLIQLVATDVRNMKVNLGSNLFPSQYFDYFKDSIMINPETEWVEPIFKGKFQLAPSNKFEFSTTLGRFGIPSIHFDTLKIIKNEDTLIYKNKTEIYKAFKTDDNRWFYLTIKNN